MTIEWVECEPPEPVYDRPPCPGPTTHEWSLAVEEGQLTLFSGCSDCDGLYSPVENELVYMEPIRGRIEGHLEVCGYETPEYSYWWGFVPE